MASMKGLNLRPSANGYPTFARVASDHVNAKALGIATNEDETIPAGAKFVIFSSTADFYAKPGGSAAVPSDTADGSAAELNPAIWALDGSFTVIGLIAPAACVVTLSYYAGGGTP